MAAKKTTKTCLWCSKPAAKGRSLCPAHLEQLRERKAQRTSEGICRDCPNLVDEGHSLCPACLAKRREAYATRGTCNDCGTEVEGASRCPKCAEAHRRRKRERYACK